MSASWYVGATVFGAPKFEVRDVTVEAGLDAAAADDLGYITQLFSIRRNLEEHEARALAHALNLCLGLVDETTREEKR